MKKITSLTGADSVMTGVNKGLTLIDSTYGKIGLMCFKVSEFLTSVKGKKELAEAKISAKGWLTARLTVSVNAFYNAVRRYKKDRGIKGKSANKTKKTAYQFVKAYLDKHLSGLSVSQLENLVADLKGSLNEIAAKSKRRTHKTRTATRRAQARA